MILVGIIILCITTCGTRSEEACTAGCKCCHKEIRDTLKSLADLVKGMEPMVAEKQAICDVVEIRGLSSIRYNEKSCFKEIGPGQNGPCYSQNIQIIISQVNLGCALQDPVATVAQLTKDAAKKSLEAAKGVLGKIGGAFGKREAEKLKSNFIINASWSEILVDIEMKLCFDDENFNITKLEVSDKSITGLKIWCEGSAVTGQLCGAITSADAIRGTIGMLVKFFAKKGLASALGDPMLKEELLLMNCNDLA